MKEVEIKASADTLTVNILCEIDHHTAKKVREAADEKINTMKPKRVVLDFSKVVFMDSSGIGLIIGRAGEAKKAGVAEVSVEGLSPALMKLVRMAGIEKIKGLKIGVSK